MKSLFWFSTNLIIFKVNFYTLTLVKLVGIKSYSPLYLYTAKYGWENVISIKKKHFYSYPLYDYIIVYTVADNIGLNEIINFSWNRKIIFDLPN